MAGHIIEILSIDSITGSNQHCTRRFTWSNERREPHMARLDRFLISPEWNVKYLNSIQKAVANTSLEHCPILYTARTQFRKSKIFRFENCWLRFEQFSELVIHTWSALPTAHTPLQLETKFNNVLRHTIKNWAATKIGSIKVQIKTCRDFLTWSAKVKEQRELTDLEKFVQATLKHRHTELAVLEEDIWKQRAKTRWELHGDKGTKYFHALASGKKRRNTIPHIEHNGEQFLDQQTKSQVFFSFYKDLIGSDSPKMPHINWSNLYPNTHNLEALAQPIMVLEIKEAIKQWPNHKSPGPNGFLGEFYKTYADLIAPDLLNLYTTVTEQDCSLTPLNTSYIVLLPKVSAPLRPTDFRSISLLHGVQNFFSKILSNRLQGQIQKLIDNAQTGFLKGRQITENYLYVQHLLHHAKATALPLALFKADIKKAFNTVSWEFIIAVLKNLGFPDTWLGWIHRAILRGTSQILINGLLGKKIQLKRGVRQGDPLSPLLFILAMDFIARYFTKLVQTGGIKLLFPHMKPCLLYADDTIFFVKPEPRQLQALKVALYIFENISGLAVNLSKSELLLIKTIQPRANELATLMGCKLGTFPFTYLGLPLFPTKLPKSTYLPLLTRFSTRLTGWAARYLSIAGRLVLLNSVLSSLPVYFMSVLLLPEWVLKEIDKIRRRFLWHGVSTENRKINLASWTLVCMPKKAGGMGVIDLKSFNHTLLLKWLWRWVKPEQRLWKPVMLNTVPIVNYVPQSKFFVTTLKPIYQFAAISFEYVPGDGSRIAIWDHNWGHGLLKMLLPNLYTHTLDMDTSLQQAGTANPLSSLFRQTLSTAAECELQTLNTILTQTVLEADTRDDIRWRWHTTGRFTVKSAYIALTNRPLIRNHRYTICRLPAPPRMRVFGWLMILNRLLTIDNLVRRGWSLVNRCVLCKNCEETVSHLFNECTLSIHVYGLVVNLLGIARNEIQDVELRTEAITDKGSRTSKIRSILLVSQFVIWKERCSRIFRDETKQANILAEEIIQQLHAIPLKASWHWPVHDNIPFLLSRKYQLAEKPPKEKAEALAEKKPAASEDLEKAPKKPEDLEKAQYFSMRQRLRSDQMEFGENARQVVHSLMHFNSP
ncbi:uncharacterized protein LOC144545511 [Carex rostrata]